MDPVSGIDWPSAYTHTHTHITEKDREATGTDRFMRSVVLSFEVARHGRQWLNNPAVIGVTVGVRGRVAAKSK